MIEIKRWDNGEIIHSGDFKTIKDCLEDGVKEGISFYGADLGEADLRGADLYGAKLYGAHLRGANLEGADLGEADLRGAYLYGADLRGANLEIADLREADLRGADLREADLYGADLGGADLREADLGEAHLRGAQNYYLFIAYDTSKRIVHCVRHKNTFMCKAGCFWGTLDELESKVKETHNSKVYLMNIEIMRELLKDNK